MPDLSFATLDAVPDWAKEYAKEVNGSYVVKVAPQVKVDEFRDTNVRVSQERDQLKDRLGKLSPVIGDDPDAFLSEIQVLREVQQQVKDGKLKGNTDVAAEVERRVSEMKANYDRQLQEQARKAADSEARANVENSKWRRSLVDRAVTDAVLDGTSGAETSALADILERAYKTFTVNDSGTLVAKDGDAIVYGSDGATPMSPKEWLAKLRERAPYFFKNSNGGGATGAGKGGAAGSTLPGGMAREAFLKLPASARMAYARQHGITRLT